jgi:hypothetical protein
LCCDIEVKEGEGTLYIPLNQYKNMYYKSYKNKSNTSIIIFKNFENTNKDKKRTVYRDEPNNCLYFKNFENEKRVYLIPEEFEDTREYLEQKETSMAKKQMDMFEEQLENFHNLNI